VASYLFVTRLSTTYPFLTPSLDWGFKELWSDIEEPVELFTQLDDTELRRDFLAAVHHDVENWQDIYLTLFPVQLSRTMLDELLSAGCKDGVLSKLEEIIEHYREYREGLIWVARHSVESPWLIELGVKIEKIMINMIRLLDLTYNDIESKREVSYNRKLNRQIQNFLFKENQLESFLVAGTKDSAIRVFTLLEDIDQIDPVVRRNLKAVVQKTFPGIRFYGDKKTSEPMATSSGKYFFTTQESLTGKQKELKKIVEIEIPKNSKEIGAAIELGDLSENAEYKAGKEKQENLQIQAGKIKDELERVRLFSEDDREKGKVGFATIITLDDLVDEKEEVYTILGPWESNPSEKVISYLSPFGSAFLGQKAGATLEFKINDRQYKFKIKDVQPVALS
jgi:transcription elongation factor GreA